MAKKENKIYKEVSIIEMLPKGIIFKELGGFKKKEVIDDAEKIENALLKFMQVNNAFIEVARVRGKHRLVFTKQAQ